eukprot:TRINITY_DN8576_c0_g1_i1.p1 TRINITY_DN8576_c0_g1~~TRINITY_DN8576_c0_g1_i1.p1  ORF type:complete len:201 (+),score=16.39 TRINITY_DN8576_c0_g1_i1:324-926(+)
MSGNRSLSTTRVRCLLPKSSQTYKEELDVPVSTVYELPEFSISTTQSERSGEFIISSLSCLEAALNRPLDLRSIHSLLQSQATIENGQCWTLESQPFSNLGGDDGPFDLEFTPLGSATVMDDVSRQSSAMSTNPIGTFLSEGSSVQPARSPKIGFIFETKKTNVDPALNIVKVSGSQDVAQDSKDENKSSYGGLKRRHSS